MLTLRAARPELKSSRGPSARVVYEPSASQSWKERRGSFDVNCHITNSLSPHAWVRRTSFLHDSFDIAQPIISRAVRNLDNVGLWGERRRLRPGATGFILQPLFGRPRRVEVFKPFQK